jgi:peptide/nickel transport system substrate-binding protein
VARALAAAFAAALVAVVPGAGAAPDAETPRRGGTVVLTGVAREPACLNAFFKRCRSADDFATDWVMSAVLPGAYRVGPGLTLRPHLVSHVDFTRTPPFALTYHIRSGARWSDGTPVSARDFVFTWKTSLSAGVELHEVYAADLAQIADVRALNARTVRVVPRSRFGGWRRLFPYVLPEHVLSDADFGTVWNERIFDPRTGRPIGSGPWLVRGWERGRAITFERNPRYWGGRPAYLDRLVLRFRMGNEEAIEGLRRGELDLVHGLPLSVGETREIRQLAVAGIRTQSVPGPGWVHLEFRVRTPGHPALRNKLVRRAIAHAIDRTALVRAQVPAADRRNAAIDSVVFATTSRHYRPNWSRLRYDPAWSVRLLRQAGCRLGADGIYVCAGERLSLRGFTIAGNASFEGGLRVLSEQLRRAGIEVRPTYAALGSLFGQNGIVASGAFDVLLFSWGRRDDEPGENQILRCGGTQNFTGYCQRLVTRDLDEAGRVLDADQRARVLNRVDARVASDVPLLPLYHLPLIGGASPKLRGYAPSGPLNPFVSAEDWWLAR